MVKKQTNKIEGKLQTTLTLESNNYSNYIYLFDTKPNNK